MKKILLLAIAALLLVNACEKDKGGKDHPYKQKLLGEWVQYGSYGIMRGGAEIDTVYSTFNIPDYWTFYENNIVNVTDIEVSDTDYEYWIANDTMYMKAVNNPLPVPSRAHIRFAGDSCIRTSAWGGTSNHYKSIHVL